MQALNRARLDVDGYGIVPGRTEESGKVVNTADDKPLKSGGQLCVRFLRTQQCAKNVDAICINPLIGCRACVFGGLGFLWD